MKVVAINQQKYTDQEYLDGIKKGDSKILKAFYKSFFPRIRHYVENNNGKEADAEDLFQEATVVLFRKLSAGGFTLTSGLFTFIYAVCQRLWLNRLKKNNRENSEIPTDDTLKADDIVIVEQTEQYSLYRQKFQELGEDCQQILTLFFEKVKMVDIAQKMDLSPAYTKKRKHHCKEKLVKLIKADSSYIELTSNY